MRWLYVRFRILIHPEWEAWSMPDFLYSHRLVILCLDFHSSWYLDTNACRFVTNTHVAWYCERLINRSIPQEETGTKYVRRWANQPQMGQCCQPCNLAWDVRRSGGLMVPVEWWVTINIHSESNRSWRNHSNDFFTGFSDEFRPVVTAPYSS